MRAIREEVGPCGSDEKTGNEIESCKRGLACAASLRGGWGGFSAPSVDAARSPIEEAHEEAVGDAVDGVFDDVVGAPLDSDDFEFPFAVRNGHADGGDAWAVA